MISESSGLPLDSAVCDLGLALANTHHHLITMAAQEQASKGESRPLSDTDSDTTHVKTASTQTNPAPDSSAPAKQV